MAIARLTGQDASGASTTTSAAAVYPTTPTQFNLMVAIVFGNVLTGNTTISGWTLASEGVCGATASNGSISIHYKVAGAGESTTITANSTGASVMRIQVYEYSGAATSSVTDGTSTPANSGSTSVTSQIATTVGHTTSNANDLLVAGWGFSATTSAWSVDSSFNLLQTGGRMVGADRIVAATGTYNPTLSWTSAMRAGGVVAAFQALPAGGTAASGTASLALTAAGGAAATGAATGTVALSAAGGARATSGGTANLAITAAGGATGGASATASLALTAAGTARGVAAATAALVLSAAGTVRAVAAATAQLLLSATGTATAPQTVDPNPYTASIQEQAAVSIHESAAATVREESSA